MGVVVVFQFGDGYDGLFDDFTDRAARDVG